MYTNTDINNDGSEKKEEEIYFHKKPNNIKRIDLKNIDRVQTEGDLKTNERSNK